MLPILRQSWTSADIFTHNASLVASPPGHLRVHPMVPPPAAEQPAEAVKREGECISGGGVTAV